jgi:hypothetical protein
MRAILMMAVALAAGMSARAAECTVTVEMTNPSAVPAVVLVRAKEVAAGIFAEIGVELRWGGKRHGCASRIEVQLEAAGSPEFRRDSLAYAALGVAADQCIHVFVDRVNSMVPAPATGALLGHVLAHEIAHVLEGSPRHSEEGVMKARWELTDLRELTRHPLRFQLVDEALIHAGLTHAEVAANN